MIAKRKPRKFRTGGGTELTSPSGARYRLPLLDDEDSGGRKSKPPAVRTGEPSGGRLAKRGRTEVTRPGRPSIDVNGRQKRLSGFKDVSGPAERVNKPALTGPKKPALAEAPKPRSGLGKLGVAAALMGYSPKVGEGSDIPRNYPGEGLQPAKKSETATVPAPKPASASASASASAPKPAEAKPVRASAPSATPAKTVKASKPVTKVSTPTATKAKASSDSRSFGSRSSGNSDSYDDDLRAAVRRMRDTSSEMAEKTGTMKEKMGEFSRSFKKGGAIKSRGDGIAKRGTTKGRFV